jgi:hypothetical protein
VKLKELLNHLSVTHAYMSAHSTGKPNRFATLADPLFRAFILHPRNIVHKDLYAF